MTTMKESVRRVADALREVREPATDAIGTRRGIVIERIAPELDG